MKCSFHLTAKVTLIMQTNYFSIKLNLTAIDKTATIYKEIIVVDSK